MTLHNPAFVNKVDLEAIHGTQEFCTVHRTSGLGRWFRMAGGWTGLSIWRQTGF